MKTTKKHFLHKKILYPIKIYQDLPPFISNHNRDYDNNYYRCFCIDYKMFETNTFSNTNGWYTRYRAFMIPKIRNNILKFLFGTRMYYIRTEHDKDFVTFSEDITKKDALERVAHESCDCAKMDIYFSHIEYGGFLFTSKREKKCIIGATNMMLSIFGKNQSNNSI